MISHSFVDKKNKKTKKTIHPTAKAVGILVLKLINEIASFLSKDVICLEKNSISDIKQFVFSQSFMKNEKAGIINALDSMGSTFKMNKIKANQRKRFVNILFKKINLPSNAKVLFLDDSIFGGYTFLSMVSSVINIQDIKFDSLVLFSK